MSVLVSKSPSSLICKMVLVVLNFVMLISVGSTVDAKYLLVKLDEVQGFPNVHSRSSTNAMKIGEVRKFEVDKNKKKECGLPGEGVIEIEIKKVKGKIQKYSFQMVNNEKEAFLNCDHGHISQLKTKGKAENCGIGRILTELCMNEKNLHRTSTNKNLAFSKMDEYIKIYGKKVEHEEKVNKLKKLKERFSSHCSKLIYLWMKAKPPTGAHVYFNSATHAGFTELFMINAYTLFEFYPDEGPCPVKTLQDRYSDDGYMVEGDKRKNVVGWNWFFCKPKVVQEQPKCTIL